MAEEVSYYAIVNDFCSLEQPGCRKPANIRVE